MEEQQLVGKQKAEASIADNAIFVAMVDPALIYNSHMNVIAANPAFISRYGINPTGMNVKELISFFSCKWLDERHYRIEEQPTPKALKGIQTSGALFSIVFKGVECIVETSSSPIYQNSRIVGALTVWHQMDSDNVVRQAISESARLHRKINDVSPIAVIICNDEIIEYANPAAIELFGASHVIDLNKKTIFDLISEMPSDRNQKGIESKIVRINGEERDVEILAVNISGKANMHIFLRDITQKKKIEYYNNTLSSIEQFIHNTIKSVEITQHAMEMAAMAIHCDSAAVSFLRYGFWEVNHVFNFKEDIRGLKIPEKEEPHASLALRSKKIVFIENGSKDKRVNSKRLKNWGIQSVIVVPLYTHHESIGVIFFNFYNQTDFPEELVNFLTRFSTALSLALKNSELFEDLQKELVLKLENEKELLLLNSNLRNSEERFRLLTEKSNALICELENNGDIVYANSKFKEILGYSTSRDVNIFQKCMDSDEERLSAFLFGMNDKEKNEWVLKDTKGNWRWFRCHPSAFSTSTGNLRHSLILFDLTDIKATEQKIKNNAQQLKELNATKDKFFSIIAHDLKNPFTNLLGSSELLITMPNLDRETVQKLVKIIYDSSRRGYTLLENLLEWSRTQTGTISFEPEPLLLSDQVSLCTSVLKDTIESKNQNLRIDIPESILVLADKNMLQTIIRNLLHNAIKYTHNKGNISLAASNSQQGVTINVEDDGVGISPENLKKLFRIDTKFSSHGTSMETGTGLGLLLCKEFIERHGGKIWVQSQPGSGSKFSFFLPQR